MSVTGRTCWMAAGIAAVLNILALFLFFSSGSASSSGYAVLSLPQSVDDATTLNSLEAAGLRSIVCESTQWVDIGDFDRLEQIPLSAWSSRVEPFDPRNDGWAAALSSLFVSDGTRRFFIPLSSQPYSLRGPALNSLIGDRFAGLDWRLSRPASSLPPFWFFILFSTVIAVAFFLSGRSAAVLLLIPSLLCLSGGSAQGFAAAGFLGIAGVLFSKVLREFIRTKRWIFLSFVSLGSLILAVVAAFLSGVSPLASLLMPITGIVSIAAGVMASEYRAVRHGHRRFMPVSLRPHPRDLISDSRLAIPFAAAACLLLLFNLVWGAGFGTSPSLPSGRVSIAGYQAHLDFQKNFSRKSLFQEAASDGHYDHYVVGSDGLLEIQTQKTAPSATFNQELPPAERMVSHWGRGSVGGLFPVLACLLISMVTLPALLYQVRRRQQARLASAYSEKRIAA